MSIVRFVSISLIINRYDKIIGWTFSGHMRKDIERTKCPLNVLLISEHVLHDIHGNLTEMDSSQITFPDDQQAVSEPFNSLCIDITQLLLGKKNRSRHQPDRGLLQQTIMSGNKAWKKLIEEISFGSV